MYTVKTYGGFNSVPLEDLNEAKEWAAETNLTYDIIDESGRIVATNRKAAKQKRVTGDIWGHERASRRF